MRKFLRIARTVKTSADAVKDTVEFTANKTRNTLFYIIAALTAAGLMVILCLAGAVNWIIG